MALKNATFFSESSGVEGGGGGVGARRGQKYIL